MTEQQNQQQTQQKELTLKDLKEIIKKAGVRTILRTLGISAIAFGITTFSINLVIGSLSILGGLVILGVKDLIEELSE